MGQAKLRGSLEERVAQGAEKQRLIEQKRMECRAAQEASLTPEERKQRHMTRAKLSMLLGLAASGFSHT